MKSLMRKIDRFCYLHPKFGIPNLMLYVVIAMAATWLIGLIGNSTAFYNTLAFDPEMVFLHGQVWRLVTFIVIPESSGILTLLYLYFSFVIARSVERTWGNGKFTIYYLSGALLNILYGLLFWLITGVSPAITPTYLNLSLFFAFATLYPDTIFLLFFIIPIKAKWLAIFDAVLFVAAIVTLPWALKLLPVVAILNYFVFCGGWLIDLLRPKKIKQRQNTINFKNAAKKYNREQASKPYTRKCEVCGRTDTSNPELEFRFCSKCGGYHCFCIDHINSHIHFTE